MRTEQFVQRVENLRRAQILGRRERARKIRPEVAQHLFPIDFVIGDEVELFLKGGGEIIADIAGEEAFKEGGDDAALVLGIEAFLIQPDVITVAQHPERRGIGRGPADAEFFHPLDEARLGEARRRLGAVLARFDLVAGQRLAGGHRRQTARFIVFFVVAAFLIELQETVEADHLAGGAQVELVYGRTRMSGYFHVGI